jgi:transketolase
MDTLLEIAARDDRICLLTGDLGFSVVERFAERFPRRFFNVGVAEANMIGLATGLALEGWIPYAYSIATFASMRAYEQLRHGPVLHGLPVRVLGIGGGFAYGHAGVSHFALEDYAIMRAQPGLTVIAPADPEQTRRAIRATYDLPGPIYYRIGKGGNDPIPALGGRFSLDGVECLGEGRDVLVVTTGGIAVEALEGVALAEREKTRCTTAIAATLSPSPVAALKELLGRFSAVVSVEEHYATGGLSSLLSEVIAEWGVAKRFRSLAVRSVPSGVSGSQRFMWGATGLTRAHVADAIRSVARIQGT